jgi:FixJ family two-component response regulator
MNKIWQRDSNGCKEPEPGAPLVSIVDDDPSVRRSTRRLLRCSGLRAEAFSTGEDFLRSECVAETSCLILDVRMPGIDGLELQRRLGKAGRTIPIVFLTARASDEEERQAWQAGAVNFLRKPIAKNALLDAIQAVLENSTNNRRRDL